jgi:hypothetical protein
VIPDETHLAAHCHRRDFAASDGDRSVGRIYRHDTSAHQRGQWFWTMNAFGPGIDRGRAQCSGMAETKAEAVRLVEEAYERYRM